jgi:hypothetical protein
MHPMVAQSSDAFDEDAYRNALHGVEVDRGATSYGVVSRFEPYFADEPTDRCRARRNDRSTKSRYRGVAGENYNGSTPDFRRLAPPQLATQW